MSNDWTAIAGQIVSSGAPVLGGLLAGPAGTAMGDAVGSLIGAALGVAATPGAIAGAIAANPANASAAISAVESAHAPSMTAIAAQLRDAADARAQTLSLTKEGSEIAWGAPVVSAIIVLGFAGLTLFAAFHGVADNPVTNILVGTFAAGFGNVVGYWLGSSASSRAKDATISAAVKAR